jgi:hypothetical protein
MGSTSEDATDEDATNEDRYSIPGWPAWLISSVCLVLLAAHLALRAIYGDLKDGLDAVAIAIAAVGLSPWLGKAIDSIKIAGAEVKFARQLQRQDREIRQLQFLMANFLTRWEAQHLEGLSIKGGVYNVDIATNPKGLEAELRRLRALGFIKEVGDMHLHDLLAKDSEPKLGDQPVMRNAGQVFRITPAGRQYLEFRDKELDSE